MPLISNAAALYAGANRVDNVYSGGSPTTPVWSGDVKHRGSSSSSTWTTGNTTSRTVAMPPAAQVGDLALLVICVGWPAPSGWALVSEVHLPGLLDLYVYSKTLTAGDLNSVLTIGGGSAQGNLALHVFYRPNLGRSPRATLAHNVTSVAVTEVTQPTVTNVPRRSTLISIWAARSSSGQKPVVATPDTETQIATTSTTDNSTLNICTLATLAPPVPAGTVGGRRTNVIYSNRGVVVISIALCG